MIKALQTSSKTTQHAATKSDFTQVFGLSKKATGKNIKVQIG